MWYCCLSKIMWVKFYTGLPVILFGVQNFNAEHLSKLFERSVRFVIYDYWMFLGHVKKFILWTQNMTELIFCSVPVIWMQGKKLQLLKFTRAQSRISELETALCSSVVWFKELLAQQFLGPGKSFPLMLYVGGAVLNISTKKLVCSHVTLLSFVFNRISIP